jgi:small subunit ribosomal protein S20e|eukprot:TRINITY_DN169_c0_g2_i12.p1 TRINITY_DN169_c0_g2~~TRINITY_DN169_c0_g2_i12.p1  ORF type:complete len:119 (-),score=54.13 TRINITY_DN169_c0_g2_i12:153-509(-)
MAFVKKNNKEQVDVARVHITLTSTNPKAIEKVCSDLLTRSKENQVTVRGPMRLPTRTLKHTTRKTPCGNGTNTWDTYEMKIYKRAVYLLANEESVRKIMAIELPVGVDVDAVFDKSRK